jgi:hypothetical protein
LARDATRADASSGDGQASQHDAIQNAAGDIMRLMHRHQQFTFDDVIFNAISLFDLSAISVKRWAATPMLLIESSV